MNIVQSLFRATRAPDTPPHVGEVMNMWVYHANLLESRVLSLLTLNHTSDSDLKNSIEHMMSDVLEPQVNQLGEFLRNEGIPLAPATGEKPKADEREIPQGAKMTDAEIANTLSLKLEALLHLANSSILITLREDIGAMFYRFHAHLLLQFYNFRKLMQLRGWLRVPPYYYANRVPTST